MAEAVVTLKKGEGRSLKAGGLWIDENQIDTITGTFPQRRYGDWSMTLTVIPWEMVIINQNSKIRIRIMTRKSDQLK